VLQANGASELLRSPHLARLRTKAFLLFPFWIATSWMIPGCSVVDYIGAYFNTFYNAQRQFAEAEQELLTQPDVKQKDRPFGYTFNVQSATKAKFTAVIDKCSKLLQYHPESNLIDDALLMIGKSYYYQNDYQPAERKFRELLEQFPTSAFAYESKLLLGYTYYVLNDKTKSSEMAKGLLEESDKNGEDDYSAKASVLLAQLAVDDKNIHEAVAHYLNAAEKAGTAEERCTAYLNLGALLSQEGDNQRAYEAYRKAENASTNYQTTYKGRMGQARMLSKLGDYEESLSMLRDLLSSSNYREFYGEINLEAGNVFKESKDYDSAIRQYEYVDTSYARTETSANSYFQLGDLYEMRLFQFDSAQVFYSKGKSEFPQALITSQLSLRAEYLTKYLQLRNEIRRLDSIKVVLLSSSDTSLLLVNTVSDSTLDSLQERTDSTLQVSVTAAPDSTLDTLHKKPNVPIVRTPAQPLITLDSVNARLAYNMSELAALFYTSMSLPDSSSYWCSRLLVEHPISRQAPRALFTLAQIYSLDSTRSRSTSDSLYREIVDRFPDSEFAPEAERLLGLSGRAELTDPAEAAYARAEKLLGTDNSQAAEDTLRMIVRTYPSSPVASKAQYALGWMYESVNVQLDSAAANYRALVVLYPGSEYARQVKPRLEEYDLNKKALEQSSKDSASVRMIDSTSVGVMDTLGVMNGEKKGGKEKLLDPNTSEDPALPPKQEKE
jgi:TolA-binding protein